MMQRYRLPLTREVPIPSDEEALLPQPIAYYYLAADVDTRIADLELAAKENARYSTEIREEFERRGARIAELEKDIAEKAGLIAALQRSNDRLRQKLDRLSS